MFCGVLQKKLAKFPKGIPLLVLPGHCLKASCLAALFAQIQTWQKVDMVADELAECYSADRLCISPNSFCTHNTCEGCDGC